MLKPAQFQKFEVVCLLQVADDQGHGGAVRGADGQLPGAEHPIWVEEHLQRLPPRRLRPRRADRRNGIPDHREDHP